MNTTNAAAADAVRTAIQNLHGQKDNKRPNKQTGEDYQDEHKRQPREVDCLTVEEEQKLLGYYCLQTMRFADFINLPSSVKVTKIPSKCSGLPRLILPAGYRRAVYEALLRLEFTHDLSSQRNHAYGRLLGDED